ncbi:MAG: leucine/isoleucine/valine transporter permease subunit [Chloroflexi bacterium]|nr:leucine/isoleucine/valine transporter permease subunit [Chloroflexota bacterium]
MNPIWRSTLKAGLLTGAIVIYVALTGMVLSLSQRPVIGKLSLGHVVYMLVFVGMGYITAVRSPWRQERPWLVPLQGAVVGGVGAAILALLPLIGRKVDLGWMFVTAKPELYKFLLFNQEQVARGVLYLILTGAVLGGVAAVLPILPEVLHKALLGGASTTLLLGVLAELVQRTVLKKVLGPFFAYKGLKPTGAAILFVVLTVLFGLQAWWRQKHPKVTKSVAAQEAEAASPLRTTLQLGALLLFLLILPVWILNKDTYLNSVVNLVGLYIIMGLGLNIVVGFAGLLDLGYVAFFAIGAYTVALMTSLGPLGHGYSFWQALPVAILLALTAGVVLGIPVLRMRGDYLAIVTLGFGEIIRILANSDWLKPFMGGALGVLDIPKPKIGNWVLKEEYQLYYLILAGILVTWFVASRLYHSRVGRAWQALREDEDVAEAMGIHLVTTKLLAFGFGAAFSGLSGAIFAAKVGSVYPHTFNLIISINVLSLIIVGGIGSLPGVVVGALALVGLPELLREFSEYRMLFYGIALIAMMLVKPEGFWPKRLKVYPRPQEEDAEASAL